ncbi:hypothetical protein [Pseudoduganella rhizocola]|uniref:hypothetical protein n=1 Tax=Pseudoduganella rhizocola TaxID=3382643 RepID=UPI0038B52F98
MAFQVKIGDSGSRNLTAEEAQAVEAAKKRYRESIGRHYPAELVRQFDLAVEKLKRKYPDQAQQQAAAGPVSDGEKKLMSAEVRDDWTSRKKVAGSPKY